MREMGPTMRLLIDAAAIAHAVDDAGAAAVMIKRLAQGLAFADLAPPVQRDAAERLSAVLRGRVRERFEAWLEQIAAPPEEAAFALARFESNGVRVVNACARALTPAATPVETAMALFLDAASRDPVFERDLIVRDIGWRLAKSAFAAAHDARDDLRALGLTV